MKNPFEKALRAKKAKQAAVAKRRAGADSVLKSERAEQIKNGKFLSSTRADKK